MPQETETSTHDEAFAELMAHGTASDMVVYSCSYRASVEDKKTLRVTNTLDSQFSVIVEFPYGVLTTSSTWWTEVGR